MLWKASIRCDSWTRCIGDAKFSSLGELITGKQKAESQQLAAGYLFFWTC